MLLLHLNLVWSRADDPAKTSDPKAEVKDEKKPLPKPDPTGANSGDKTAIGDDPKLPTIEVDKKDPDKKDEAYNQTKAYLETVADFSGKNRSAINMMWTLITGFLVMFMQAGFAMVETGLTRAKNVSHTMAMNLMIYSIGVLSFWAVGFALMFGAYNSEAAGGGFLGGDANLLVSEFKITLMGKEFGVFGHQGFFLAGNAFDSGIMTLFLFQMVFMDTAATIPTGTLAERWKFLAFVVYGFFIAGLIYPIYGNWVWGGGWLSKLGTNFGLGHGHVDFAGSSVVHMVGGITALAGAMIVGARIGKYNKDGTVNALPAHNVPMYVVGTFILAFGWFGFNPGSTLSGADMNIGRIAANTMLASAGGAFSCMCYMWIVYKKPDPSFMCNGLLAGLVAITAPCAFVAPWAAVLIGAVAGILVVWSCVFWEKVAKIDDPVGAISVHGVNGAWGVLSLGLFADGTYGASNGWNGVYAVRYAGKLYWLTEAFKADKLPDAFKGMAHFDPTKVEAVGVTGLFYGNPNQFYAECIGVAANILWVFPVALLCFYLVEKIIGNRVSAAVELQGLDINEMGVLGYINEDPKVPEGHITHAAPEPRHAEVPRNGKQRHYTVVVEGLEPETLKAADLVESCVCPATIRPPLEFLGIYPFMNTVRMAIVFNSVGATQPPFAPPWKRCCQKPPMVARSVLPSLLRDGLAGNALTQPTALREKCLPARQNPDGWGCVST